MIHFRWFRIMFVLFLIGPMSLIVHPTSVDSAHSTNEQIAIHPATPSFSQPFFVTVSGQWANSCIPVFQSMDVGERIVRLLAKTPGSLVSCQDIQMDWSFSILVPPQSPDFYTAEVSIVSGISGQTLSTVRHDFDVVGGLQVIPALPLVNQEVRLHLADLSLDSCVPQYISHGVVTQTVQIEAKIPDLLCGQVPTPWQMDIALGPLAGGIYQAELFVTDYRQTPPKHTRLLDGSFVVAEQVLDIYIPMWGCFGANTSLQACSIVQTPDQRGEKP